MLIFLLGLIRYFERLHSQRTEELISSETVLRGEAICKYIARASVDGVVEENPLLLSKIISDSQKEVVGLRYLLIVDDKGKIWASTDSSQVGEIYHPLSGLDRLTSEDIPIQQYRSAKGEKILEIAAPIKVADKKIGGAYLGISQEKAAKRSGRIFSPTLPILFTVGALGTFLVVFIFSLFVKRWSETTLLKREELERLRNLEEEKVSLIAQIEEKRREEDEIRKKLEELNKEEGNVSERVKAKNEEDARLTQRIEAISKEEEELVSRIEVRRREESSLIESIEEKKKLAASLPSLRLEEMSKLEKEVWERIEAKRREESILAQRIEEIRKKVIDLDRRIEARKKEEMELAEKLKLQREQFSPPLET